MASVAIQHQCPRGNSDDQILSAPAVAVAPSTYASVFRPPVFAVNDLRQAIGPRHGSNNDMAAVAAVAAVRPSSGNVFLPSEATTAPAAITAFDVKSYSIDKHSYGPWPVIRRPLQKTNSM
jgi:hypothetical protein